jgi:wyosine [tRNA(Phe)-imidazoG37] synthetase (radical SAM superfamily)
VIRGRGHVYGPVPSRRLGASLGVDVVPLKACPYDCIYCQLGSTRKLTAERVAFFPVDEILADVERRLQLWPPPDVLTIAGSGEPTLFTGLGALIDGIKRITDTRVALLTNGALFYRADVRAEAAHADIVLPSLDAGDEATFQVVNRPVAGLTLQKVVEGLAAFRRSYFGEIWLEVMIVAGFTDTPESVGSIAALSRRIAPDRVQLNTPVRPTFDERAAPVVAERLADLCRHFTPEAEVVAEWGGRAEGEDARRAPESDEVLTLLQRRPCTVDDVAAGLGLHPNAVVKLLATLERSGEVHRVLRNGRVFWRRVPAAGARAADSRGKRT